MHSSKNFQQKKDADAFLTNFTKSPECNSIMNQLLTDQELSVRFFGATTLSQKIRKNWSDFPNEQKQTLTSFLPNCIMKYSTDASSVRNQLCLACAAAGVRMLTDLWPSFLVELFQGITSPPPSSNPLSVRTALFQTLSSVADEYKYLSDPSLQKLVLSEIQKHVRPLLDIIWISINENQQNFSDPKQLQEYQKQKQQLVVSAFGCLEKWCKLGLTLKLLTQHNLFGALFSLLNDSKVCNIASSILSYIFEEGGTTYQNPRFREGMYDQSIEEKAFQHILGLVPIYNQTIIAHQKQQSSAIIKLLSSFGSSNIPTLSNGLSRNEVLEFFNFALLGVGHPDRWISEYILDFWLLISAKVKLVPLYEKLFPVVVKQCSYPVDYDVEDEEVTETLQSYRKESTRVLRAAYGILKDSAFQYLLKLLNESNNWTEIEVSLFTFMQIGPALERSPEMSNNIVNNFITKILLLPEHLILTSTCLQFIDNFSASFMGRSDIVLQCIGFASKFVTRPEKQLRHAAASCLKSVFTDCIEGIPTQLIHTFINSLNDIKVKERKLIIEGLVALLHKIPEGKSASLLLIMNSIFFRISIILQSKVTYKTCKHISLELSNLEACTSKKTWGSEVELLENMKVMWSKMSELTLKISNNYSVLCLRDYDIMGNIFSIFSSSISLIGPASAPFVPTLSKLMVDTFAKTFSGAVFGTLSTLASFFGDKEMFSPYLSTLLVELSALLFNKLQTENLTDFEELISAYYETLYKIQNSAPVLLTPNIKVNSIFLATKCLQLDEMCNLRNVVVYIEDMFFASSEPPLDILQNLGGDLVQTLLKAVLSTGHFRLMNSESKILFKILINFQKQTLSVISTFLENPIGPVSKLSVEQRNILFNIISSFPVIGAKEEQLGMSESFKITLKIFLDFIKRLNATLNGHGIFENILLYRNLDIELKNNQHWLTNPTGLNIEVEQFLSRK
uniref:Importin N-terminal domain-containing protein n=1 Tax=Arcella intermedia TaxID=1963864 RepID=A0A6B2KXH3_9EUKA